MRRTNSTEIGSSFPTSFLSRRTITGGFKRPLYQILAPYPHTSRTEPDTFVNPPYGKHAVIAEGANLDIPHKSAWMFTTQKQKLLSSVQEPPRAQVMIELEDGTWEKRDQSPEPEYHYESDGEVLHLDNDIMERNLDTGFIGECGRSGCLKVLGCVDCLGRRPKIPTPRSTFREAILQARNISLTKGLPLDTSITTKPPLEPRENTNECFPKHLERLGSPSVVIPYKAPSLPAPRPTSRYATPRTGPKIKYVRKRAAETLIEKTLIHKKAKTVNKRKLK